MLSHVLRHLITASAVLTTSVCGAEENRARTAVDQAFARQKALPGYVEHQFEITADRAKETQTTLRAIKALSAALALGGSVDVRSSGRLAGRILHV
jgi:hypothetical protein